MAISNGPSFDFNWIMRNNANPGASVTVTINHGDGTGEQFSWMHTKAIAPRTKKTVGGAKNYQSVHAGSTKKKANPKHDRYEQKPYHGHVESEDEDDIEDYIPKTNRQPVAKSHGIQAQQYSQPRVPTQHSNLHSEASYATDEHPPKRKYEGFKGRARLYRETGKVAKDWLDRNDRPDVSGESDCGS